MPLPDELLQLAGELARTPIQNATQATYRRAISTAYYAVFHLLAEAATNCASQQQPYELRSILLRLLQHNQMKKAAQLFSKGLCS